MSSGSSGPTWDASGPTWDASGSHMGRFRSHMGPPAAAKHRVQGSTRLALLVAQVGQGEERLGVVVGGYRIHDATVGATVRVRVSTLVDGGLCTVTDGRFVTSAAPS